MKIKRIVALQLLGTGIIFSISSASDQTSKQLARAYLEGSKKKPAVEKIPLVNLTVEGFTLGPTKATGQKWDGLGGGQAQDAVLSIGKAFAATEPHLAVASVLAGPLLHGTDPPDPYGWIMISTGGGFKGVKYFADRENAYQNSYIVGLQPAIFYPKARWNEGTKLKISITDRDLSDDDPIGVAVITNEQISLALEKNGVVHQVPVYEQTNRTILFVAITANYVPGYSTAEIEKEKAANQDVESQGCTKDTDCKGDRICEQGSCVSPQSNYDTTTANQTNSDESERTEVPVHTPSSSGSGDPSI